MGRFYNHPPKAFSIFNLQFSIADNPTGAGVTAFAPMLRSGVPTVLAILSDERKCGEMMICEFVGWHGHAAVCVTMLMALAFTATLR
jgi:hypothetical protein